MTPEALNIPTVVWSGIAAAAISLAGVALTIWSTTHRLRKQLEHDTKERLQDRISGLRREVYLKLSADITTLQSHLGALATKDPTSAEFAAPVQEVIAQLTKTQLVGGDEVVEQACELTALFTESLFNLMIAAKPLHELKMDIALADKFYNQYMQEAQRVIGEITGLNESGQVDTPRMESLERSFERFRELYQQSSDERGEAWEKYFNLQGEFINAVKEHVEKVTPTQTKLILALKKELGVAADTALFIERMEANTPRMEKAVAEVLTEFSECKK